MQMTRLPIIAGTLAFGINSIALSATAELDLYNEPDATVVLTTTRLRQSLADTPASVTVITAAMLTKFGIRSVPEALRLVPGMAVTEISNHDYRINYHGTNISSPRRMNVLIDGMSVYRPTFAYVNWTALPVVMEDIQRIEVTRGPNSASYGPNSMLAIVNIITKHPKSVEGAEISVGAGSNDKVEAMARYAGNLNDSTSYRLTLARNQGKGVDNVVGLNTVTTNINTQHDGSKIDRLNFRSVTEISGSESLDLQIAMLNGKQEEQFGDDYYASYPDIVVREYDINAIWRKTVSAREEFKVQATFTQNSNQQSWTYCLPTVTLLPEMGALWRSNQSYVYSILLGRNPSGGTAEDNRLAVLALRAIRALGAQASQRNCGIANQDYTERRIDLEMQDTLVYSNALRLVGGAGVRQDIGTSQTYLNGSVENSTVRIFANAEYKPSSSIVINAGGYFEADSLTGHSFSPRIALNKHFDENNTVRFVVSRANRMPNLLEKRADWSYRISNLATPINGATSAFFAQSNRFTADLQAESIVSREIGYTGNFPQHGLMIDAKVSDDNLTSLFSDRLQLNGSNYSNGNEARLRNAEFQVEYQPTDRWTVHAGYSYLLSDTTTPLEQFQYSKNSGVLAVSHQLSNGWRAALGLYKYDAAISGQSAYGKNEVTLSKLYRFNNGATITPSVTLAVLDNTNIEYMLDTNKLAANRYPSKTQFLLGARITF